MINIIPIEDATPSGIYGAHVYITNLNHEIIFSVGSIHDATLIDYEEISIKLKLKYLKKIFFLCELYFNADQSFLLKKDIETYRNYAQLDENGLKGLEILETAANEVIKNRARNYYMYVLGD